MKNYQIDDQRTQRIGFPEIIYGKSKSVDDLQNILNHYAEKEQNALVTKLQKKKGHALLKTYKSAFFDPLSGIFTLNPIKQTSLSDQIAILAAGTSDTFVVNEAYYTLAFLGHRPPRIMDIGVSGLHRLLNRLEDLKKYKVLIVIAGFEGALPTVVGGLLPQPIIAVPTSVGYGVSAKGKAALSTMLASCANGISVVNIDNGYGAAMAAIRILNLLNRG